MGSQTLNLVEKIQEWDSLLKRGKAQKVLEALNKLRLKGIPVRLRYKVASLYRRIGEFEKGLKVLTPNVLNESSQFIKGARANDLAEYAILLQKIGMYDAAIEILQKLSNQTTTKKDLYLAFCFVGKLDHQGAEPYLESYLSNQDLTPYDKLIGEVNLLSVYIELEKFEIAETLAERLISYCVDQGHDRFLANCYELKAKLFLGSGQLQQAKELYQESFARLSGDSNRYRKWAEQGMAIIEARTTGSLKPLFDFKEKAEKNVEFEAIREIDYWIIKQDFDSNIFCKLFFGTNHSSFKKKLKREFEDQIHPPQSWTWNAGEGELNLAHGSFNGRCFLKPGQKPHQLLSALFSDLYSPVSVSTLHRMIFKDEYFNIFYSTNKIKQLLHRLKSILSEHKIPLEICLWQGRVQVKLKTPLGIVYSEKNTLVQRHDFFFNSLRSNFSENEFSSSEAQVVFKLSKAQTKRVILSLIESNKIVKLRDGRKITYRVLPNAMSNESGVA